MHDARAATREELLRAHTADWVERAEGGALTRDEERALGLPWSPELVERGRRSVGATLEAADAALADGAGANLGGGTHHAFPGAGRGFCLFNDVVAATRGPARARDAAARARRRPRRAPGRRHARRASRTTTRPSRSRSTASATTRSGACRATSSATSRAARATTPTSTRSRRCCREAIARARAELCFYLAGADPFEGDRLGRLALTHAGLADRDRLVRAELLRAGIPVCVTLAGGYAERIEDTVAINLATLRAFA